MRQCIETGGDFFQLEFDEIFKGLKSDNVDVKNKTVGELYAKLYKPFKLRLKQWRFTEQDAEDVVMIAIEKIYTKVHLVKEEKAFKSWCWTVLDNNMRDWHRSKQRKAETPMNIEVDDEMEESIIDLKLETTLNTDQIHDRLCIERQWARFAEDFPKSSHALVLQAIQGHSIEEITDMIGRPTTAATKEFLSQSKKKASVYLKKCAERFLDEE